MAIHAYDPSSPRRTYRGEEEWFELLEGKDAVGHVALRRGLIACGLTPQVAGGLVWFLEDQIRLERHQTDQTRVRYRRILRELDPDTVRRSIPGFFNSTRSVAA